MKPILILIIIVAIIAIGIVAYFAFKAMSSPAQDQGTLPSSIPTVSPATNAVQSNNYPVSNTIVIGTGDGSVEVNNFYKDVKGDDEGTVIIGENKDFRLLYDRYASSFELMLLHGPVEIIRKAAEDFFLKELGVNQQQACKLKAFWSISTGVDASVPAGIYNLNFCPKSVQF